MKEKKNDKKKAIITGAIIGGGVAVTGLIFYALKKKAGIIFPVNSEEIERLKKIDTDIFTELAPSIEAVVIEPGIEKVIIERTYDIGDNVMKYVKINVENVYGD